MGTLSGSCCPQTIKTSSRIQIQVRIQEIGLLKKGTYIDMVKSNTNFQIATAISSEWVCEGGSVWGEVRGGGVRPRNVVERRTLWNLIWKRCLCKWMLPPVCVYGQWQRQRQQHPRKNGIGCSRAEPRYDMMRSQAIPFAPIRFVSTGDLSTATRLLLNVPWCVCVYPSVCVCVDNLGGKNVRTILYANHFQPFWSTHTRTQSNKIYEN